MSSLDKVKSVVCVCGGIGFPFGTASSKRIQLLGRGLVESGLPFHVLHIGPSFSPDNKQAKGGYQGVGYEYLSPVVEFPNNKLIRILCYLWGSLLLVWKLLRLPKGTLVYVYYQGCLLNFWTILLCRMFGKPVLQEACEWWPEAPQRSVLNSWMYQRIMFRWTQAALPISQHIEMLIKRNSSTSYPMHRVPVLVDPCEVLEQADLSIIGTRATGRLLWCGSLYGFIEDAKFMLEACAVYQTSSSNKIELVLCGPSSSEAERELFECAKLLGFPRECLRITGFISEQELWGYCQSANAFLMPLWNDRRSETRFPTKMGLYLAAGKPIISTAVGEIPHYLEDRRTGLFYTAGDVRSLAEQISLALGDLELARRIADNATAEVLPRVNYSSVCQALKLWIETMGEV